MYVIAVVFLLACWVLWSYPFVRQRRAGGKRESVVMAPAARWGIFLEGVSCGLLWFNAGAFKPGVVRMIASIVGAAASTALVWWAMRHLGKQWRIQAGLYPDHQLVSTGPYRIVRHPIYASMFAMILATGLLMTPWPRFLAAIAVFIVGNEIRIRTEDRLLSERFGQEFVEYRQRVAAWIPYVH